MAGRHYWIATALIVLVTASCGAAPPVTVRGPNLAGTAWVAETIAGGGVVGPAESVIRFVDDRRVSGHGGCNAFTGSYEIQGEHLVLGPLATTRRACGGAIDEQERRFLAALSDIGRYEVEDGLLLLFARDSVNATRLASKPGAD